MKQRFRISLSSRKIDSLYCSYCHAAGNAIAFMMDYENRDLLSCLKEIANMAGMEMPKEIDPRVGGP